MIPKNFSIDELSELEAVKILGGISDSINRAQSECKNRIIGCGYSCAQNGCTNEVIGCGERVELACSDSALNCGGGPGV